MLIAGVMDTLMTILEFIVPQSFLGFEGQTIIYFLAFIVGVYLIYRFFKLAFKGVLVMIAAAIFPVLANYFLGFDVPINFSTIISYGFMGVFLYLLGTFLKSSASVLKVVTWPFRKILGKSKEEKMESKIEKRMEKKRRD